MWIHASRTPREDIPASAVVRDVLSFHDDVWMWQEDMPEEDEDSAEIPETPPSPTRVSDTTWNEGVPLEKKVCEPRTIIVMLNLPGARDVNLLLEYFGHGDAYASVGWVDTSESLQEVDEPPMLRTLGVMTRPVLRELLHNILDNPRPFGQRWAAVLEGRE